MAKERKNINLFLTEDLIKRINEYYEFGSYPSRTAAIWALLEKGLAFDKEKNKYEDIIKKWQSYDLKRENHSRSFIDSAMRLLETSGEMNDKQKHLYEGLKMFVDLAIEREPLEPPEPH
jgi:hypothetical protein